MTDHQAGPRINVLPEAVVNKIAAGEVIERPASVVKELVENAMDAGARRVVVDCTDGGRDLIRVADDGWGMRPDDLELSVVTHATSKMLNASDLSDIRTLGFRGEALASIAAVSRLTIETRSRGLEEGRSLAVEGGVRRHLEPVGRAPGTTVTVRGLFFNTPARRRFLGQVETETRHITQVVTQLAAAYPEVGIRLTHNGRPALDLAPAERAERAMALLGLLPQDLVQATATVGQVEVAVLAQGRGVGLQARNHQFVIIRQRPVQAHRLVQAAVAGYGPLVTQRARPGMVVWVEPGPGQVDVNVHPAKREVRFADEAAVTAAVERAVRDALATPEAPAVGYERDPQGRRAHAAPGWTGLALNTDPVEPSGSPTVDRTQADPWGPAAAPAAADGPPQLWGTSSSSALSPPPIVADGGGGDRFGPASSVRAGEAQTDGIAEPAAVAPNSTGPEPPTRAVEPRSGASTWQVHGRFLLAEMPAGVLLIDIAAARTRIVYEEAMSQLQQGGAAAQQLLFPQAVHLSPVERQTLAELAGSLRDLGFEVGEFGSGSVLIEAAPPPACADAAGLLRRLLDTYHQQDLPATMDVRVRLARAYAASLRGTGTQPLRADEAALLLGRLQRVPDWQRAPDGQPVARLLSLEDMARLLQGR
jgi:DNA mismatch repair protein MutL